MNSLQELNGFGSSSLDVVDDRPSRVIFDRVFPLLPIDQILNITSTTPTVNAGINIVEVINYSLANVRYRIKITTGGSPLLTGSTISWPSLPGGVSLNISGSTYTLSGINSPAIWNQIKSFTWNLPANYASRPLWFLEISIIYYDSALGRDVSVDYVAYDQRFYYVASLSSAFTMSTIGEDCRLASASMNSQFVLLGETEIFEGIIDTISSSFGVICEARKKPIDDLLTNFNLTASFVVRRSAIGNLNSNFSVTSNLTSLITNLINRNYFSNQENLIFATDTPVIESLDESASYSFSLSVPLGQGLFSKSSTETPQNTFTFTGTKSQVNNTFSQMRFYMSAGSTFSPTVQFSLSLNGVVQLTASFVLNYNAGVYNGNLVYITSSNSSYVFNNADILYSSNTDLLLVGGGGCGGATENFGNSGGGGGQVLEFFDNGKPNFGTYVATVGLGGITATDLGNGSGNGTASSIFGRIAAGGRGHPGAGAPGQSGSGRTGGSGAEYASGAGAYGYYSIAGGGGGALTNGSNANIVVVSGDNRYATPGNGGSGYTSIITGQTYGEGGGGGSYEQAPTIPAGITGRIPLTTSISGAGVGGKRYLANLQTLPGGIPAQIQTITILATNGQTNTGSGGGGGSVGNPPSNNFSRAAGGPGNGGSGLIVVKFKP